MVDGGGHFTPKLGGHFELESDGHFKLESDGQYHWNLHTEEGIPVINVRNIGLGEIRENQLEYLDEDMAKTLKSHRLITNDIVFGRKGAVERHSLISAKEEGWIQGSDCIRLRLMSNEYNPTFVSYFFRTEQHKQWMTNLGSFGATMGSLNQDIISKIEIPDISLSIQNKIASILSYYDQLIESNKQRIELLEEIAEEIYREWFVRLRFPGYEEAKIISGIPVGWEKKPIDQFSSFTISKAKLKKFDDDKTYIATADVTGINITGQGETINWENKPSRAQLVPEVNSVFFARMSNTYKVLAFSQMNVELTKKLVLSSGFLGLKATSNKSLPYLFWLVKSETFHNYKDAFSNGATQVSLTNEGFHNIKWIEPPMYIIEKFGEITSVFLNEIIILNSKNKLLEETRDLLLPRLISGKLSIEHLIEKEELLTAGEPTTEY